MPKSFDYLCDAVRLTYEWYLDRMHARDVAALRDMIDAAVKEHERITMMLPCSERDVWNAGFERQLQVAAEARKMLTERLEAGPEDPIGEPERFERDGRRMVRWSAGQVAIMQPWFAAFVVAHDGAVEESPAYHYSKWLAERRREFIAERSLQDGPHLWTAMDRVVYGDQKGPFTDWLAEKYPARLLEPAAAAEDEEELDFAEADDGNDPSP